MSNILFQQNLLALSTVNSELSAKLCSCKSADYVTIDKSKSENPVPVVRKKGISYQMHSLYNPVKEAEKLFSTDNNCNGFLIFLGLGGGYHIYPYLNKNHVESILILDTDYSYIKKIIEEISLTDIFTNRKINILVDPDYGTLEDTIMEMYLPSVMGNMNLISLQNRILTEKPFFEKISHQIQSVINIISDDFASQAYFGKRWYKNIMQNLKYADTPQKPLKTAENAIIAGAGPSLETNIKSIKKNAKKSIILASDTAASFLITHDIIPDYIISIDCQHITYNHFLGLKNNTDLPVILDIASPPFLSRLFKNRIYFSSLNPLSRYVASVWRYFQDIDTSGGNVGQTAVAIAEKAGINQLFLYGLDYSYPDFKPYARDTFLYKYFIQSENRLNYQESMIYKFVSDSEVFKNSENNILSNKKLDRYYNHLQMFILKHNLKVKAFGSCRSYAHSSSYDRISKNLKLFSSGPPVMHWKQFMTDYLGDLLELPVPYPAYKNYFDSLHKKEREIWTTLFPVCASLRKDLKYNDNKYHYSDILIQSRNWAAETIKKIIDEK